MTIIKPNKITLKIISSQEKQSAFNYVFYMFKVMKEAGNDSHLASMGGCQILPSPPSSLFHLKVHRISKQSMLIFSQ